MANLTGLIALLALPAIVWLHVYRPRRPVRRVAGVFLWGTPGVQSGENGRPLSWRPGARLWMDLAAGLLLTMLAVDFHFGGSSQPGYSAVALQGVCRVALCVAVAGLLAANWYRWVPRITIALVLIIAAGPTLHGPDRCDTLVLVMDRSRSMPPTLDLVKLAQAERRPSDRLAIVGFGDKPVVERSFNSTQPVEPALNPDQSNLHAALAAALDLIPPHEPARVLVASDGLAHDSLSDSLAEQLHSRGIPIDFYHHAAHRRGDVVLDEVTGPSESEPGGEIVFDLRATFHEAAKDVPGTLRVWRDEEQVAAQPVQITVGPSNLSWRGRAHALGVSRYRFELDVAGDPNPENNVWDALLNVSGTPDVLVLNESGDDTPLVRLLRRSGLSVTASRADRVKPTLELLSGIGTCVLENVPAKTLGPDRLRILGRYVEQLGGGLVVTGGSHSFALGGYRISPLEPLLPVELRSLMVGKRPPLALVVLVASGSWDLPMDRFGMPSTADTSPLQTAMTELTQALAPADALGIVTMEVQPTMFFPFPATGVTTTETVLLPLTSAGQRQELSRAVEQLGPIAHRMFVPSAVASAVKLFQGDKHPAKHLLLLADAHQVPELLELAADQIDKAGAGAISVTIVARGAAAQQKASETSERIRGGVQIVPDADAEKLPARLLEDLNLRTGGGFVDRAIAVRAANGPSPDRVSESPDSASQVSGFHEAALRKGATATIVAADDAGKPLAAQWPRGLGRVSVLLFPVPAAGETTTGHESLDSLLVKTIRWTARCETGRGPTGTSVLGSERTASVRLDLPRHLESADPEAKSLELVVFQADGTQPSRIEQFERQGSDLVARFTLDRPQIHFPVVRRGNEVVARCPPVTLPRSSEFLREATPDDGRAVLTELARRTGGREWFWGMPLYGEPLTSYRSLVPALAWLAMLLLVLDVADRRHRLTETLQSSWRSWRLRRAARIATAEPPAEPAMDVFTRAKEQSRRRMHR